MTSTRTDPRHSSCSLKFCRESGVLAREKQSPYQPARLGSTSPARFIELLSGALWLISALACSVLTSPIDEIPDLSGEWAAAQRDLTELVPPVDGNPYGVTMGQFSLRTEPRPFYCGEAGIHAVILVKGCFRAEPDARSLGVIRYVNNDTTVVAKGASHKMRSAKEAGKSTAITDFVKEKQRVSVKYHEMPGGKLHAAEVTVK